MSRRRALALSICFGYTGTVAELAREPGWPGLFWHAFERSMNPMALLARNRRIVEINGAYEKMFGYSREQAVGQYAENFIPPSAWSRLAADWVRLMRSGAATGAREIVRADGQVVRVQDAARHEAVTGKSLILYVVLEAAPRSRRESEAAGGAVLSPRELQVVSELAMGHRIREIAENLVLAPTTVQSHARHAMAKLGARSQAHLVTIALAEGLLDADVVLSSHGMAVS
jgi:PAS domain S-box-containing protein